MAVTAGDDDVRPPYPIVLSLPSSSDDTVTVYVDASGEMGLRFDGPHFDGDAFDADLVAEGTRLVVALLRAANPAIRGWTLRNPRSVPNDAPLGQ